MNRFKRLNQTGDTIIEVMVVLAMLGLAFSISSSAAAKSLNQTRNSEEHTQALSVANSQVEAVRAALTKSVNVGSATRPFCMIDAKTQKQFSASESNVPDSAESDDLTKYPAECVFLGYSTSVVYRSQPNNGSYYEVKVRWDGVSDLGRQQVSLTYKAHVLTDGVPGVEVGPTRPQVAVKVNVIPKRPGNLSASCNDTGTGEASGIKVRLKNDDGIEPDRNLTTGSNSVALFTNLKDFGLYTATVTDVPSIADYQICPPATSNQRQAKPNAPVTITELEIRTICRQEILQTEPRPHIVGYNPAPIIGYGPAPVIGYGPAPVIGYGPPPIVGYGPAPPIYGPAPPIYGPAPIVGWSPTTVPENRVSVWWQHTGADGRKPGWTAGDKIYKEMTQQGRYEDVLYKYRGDIARNSNGYFFERWEAWFNYYTVYVPGPPQPIYGSPPIIGYGPAPIIGYGPAPPIYGPAPPIYGPAPPIYGPAPPIYGEPTPIIVWYPDDYVANVCPDGTAVPV